MHSLENHQILNFKMKWIFVSILYENALTWIEPIDWPRFAKAMIPFLCKLLPIRIDESKDLNPRQKKEWRGIKQQSIIRELRFSSAFASSSASSPPSSSLSAADSMVQDETDQFYFNGLNTMDQLDKHFVPRNECARLLDEFSQVRRLNIKLHLTYSNELDYDTLAIWETLRPFKSQVQIVQDIALAFELLGDIAYYHDF